MVKGFTAGAFDVCHAGHLIMFEDCKKSCDWLIVGLHINPKLERKKQKDKPVQTSFERYMQLKACKFIDEIIPYDTEEDLYNLLVSVKPDVRFMGNDWQGKPNYSRDKLPNMKVIYNNRQHSFSSSNLRERIKNASKD
jgi:glycerol-3-phosphate cytidylyltransferase